MIFGVQLVYDAFGVGLDYNETLMTDMAETGAGNYYFIDAPEKMTSIFQKELAGLLSAKLIYNRGMCKTRIVKSAPPL